MNKESNTMQKNNPETKHVCTRRKAIRHAMSVSGVFTVGLAHGNWVKPVVNSIIIPAHAATSNHMCSIDGPSEISFFDGVIPPNPVAIYSVTNTGDTQLTGATIDLANNGIIFAAAFSSLNGTKQETLDVGETAVFDLLALSFSSCDEVNGETLNWTVSFNETSCEFSTLVNCSTPPS